MSGELEIHGVVSRYVGKVRFVHQQNHQFVVGNFVQSSIELWLVFHHRIQAAQPNSRPSLLDGDRAIAENGNAMRLEGCGNARSIRIQVVISQNREHSKTRMQLLQKSGAGFGSAGSASCWIEPAMKRRGRDKVAGQRDHIRMQVVDDFYRCSQGYSRQGVVVKVAELRNSEAV